MIAALPSPPSGISEETEEDAIGRLVQSHAQHLIEVASRCLSPRLQAKIAAEDLVQETLLQAYRHGIHLRTWGAQRQRAWLRRVLGNQLTDAHRRYCQAARRSSRREVESQWIGDVQAPAAVADRDLADWLDSLLIQLSPCQREVLRLRYWGGQSFVEIAQHRHTSVAAARRMGFMALTRLRRISLVAP